MKMHWLADRNFIWHLETKISLRVPNWKEYSIQKVFSQGSQRLIIHTYIYEGAVSRALKNSLGVVASYVNISCLKRYGLIKVQQRPLFPTQLSTVVDNMLHIDEEKFVASFFANTNGKADLNRCINVCIRTIDGPRTAMESNILDLIDVSRRKISEWELS